LSAVGNSPASRLFHELKFRLVKARPALGSEPKPKGAQHDETARHAARLDPAERSCKPIVETSICSHSATMNHPVGHLLSDRQKI